MDINSLQSTTNSNSSSLMTQLNSLNSNFNTSYYQAQLIDYLQCCNVNCNTILLSRIPTEQLLYKSLINLHKTIYLSNTTASQPVCIGNSILTLFQRYAVTAWVWNVDYQLYQHYCCEEIVISHKRKACFKTIHLRNKCTSCYNCYYSLAVSLIH